MCLDAAALFFRYGYIPEPHSIFKNTFKLEAGHWLSVDLNSLAITKRKYWDVNKFYNLEKRKFPSMRLSIQSKKY